jgi:hypothetical protein
MARFDNRQNRWGPAGDGPIALVLLIAPVAILTGWFIEGGSLILAICVIVAIDVFMAKFLRWVRRRLIDPPVRR